VAAVNFTPSQISRNATGNDRKSEPPANGTGRVVPIVKPNNPKGTLANQRKAKVNDEPEHRCQNKLAQVKFFSLTW
jgi:histidinol-phosphate/aromatic aminotransferase/cobyric acid decarboxylase-like protein